MRSLFLLVLFSTVLFAQYENIKINGAIFQYKPEEVSIAINPNNPLEIAAGANISYMFHSFDGGDTWDQKIMESSLGVWGDPSLVYDTEGNLYFGHLSNPVTGGYWIDRIVVQKSTDNGVTWNDGAGVGFSNPRNQDKEWLAVDHSTSQYRNNLYMCWTEFDSYGSENPNDSSRILFSKSTDLGDNWAESIAISDVGGNCIDVDETVEGAVPTVGPNGEIYTSWSGPLGIMFDKSLDGGETWGTDIFVSDQPEGWDFPIPGIDRCNGMPITACDISDSPYNGNIYILWSDQRNGTNNTDIFLKRSTDGGDSWDELVKVNSDSTERHQFFPWMCVDSTTGNIYAVYYDRRNTIGNSTDVFMARSTDGGESFTEYEISENSFLPTDQVFFGDYIGIAAHKGIAYPIWTRMDNGDLSIWITKFKEEDHINPVSNEVPIVADFVLYQNYPNPFNPSTTVSFSLPHQASVTLEVFDILGNRIDVLYKGSKSAGTYEYNFDASVLPSGVYFAKLSADEFIATRKMMLLK